MKIKIFDLNCWLFPIPFSSDNKKRLLGIIDFIKGQNPDIITLQEVWMKKDVRKIKSELKDYYFFSSASKIFNRSGLLIGFKKKPISFFQKTFLTDKNYSLKEKLGGKGFQVAEISNGLFILNTQLYAIEEKVHEKITLSQFKEIEKFSIGKKLIFSGDLNLPQEIFLRENKIFKYKPHSKYTLSKKNKYCSSRLNNPDKANKIIDYILSNDKKVKVKMKVLNFVNFSDHYPLIGIVEI